MHKSGGPWKLHGVHVLAAILNFAFIYAVKSSLN